MNNFAESHRRTQHATAIIQSERYADHDTGSGHPECPDRYHVVMRSLRAAEFADRLQWVAPRVVSDNVLRGVHASGYIDIVQRDIELGKEHLSTGDTTICADTWEPALLAAGGACVAVDAVLKGDAPNAFCVVRPPGHHASADRGMGFCVFNNIAIAARYAQQEYGIGKVLIVDWDVHHGNGTQDIFYEDDSVLFFSTHQHPWYPGTGRRDETGAGRGLGTTINRPFPHGTGGQQIMAAFERDLIPEARKFRPELVLISAGFDSRVDDPLGGLLLTDQDFADLTELMVQLADELAEGRLISLLEGGYNLQGLGKAVESHCARLSEV